MFSGLPGSKKKLNIQWVFVVLLGAFLVLCLFQAEALAERRVSFHEKEGGFYSIFIDDRLLLRLRHPGTFPTIRERAERMVQELETFFSDPPKEAVTFFVNPGDGYVEGHCNGFRLFTVFQEDAAVNNSGMIDLALLWLNRLQTKYYRLQGSYQHLVREKFNGKASWYGYKFSGNPTASGEIYNPYAFTAAHRTYPPGTLIVVTNPNNGRKVVVRVNDWGPIRKTREIDLSMAAARAIGIKEDGVSTVVLEVFK